MGGSLDIHRTSRRGQISLSHTRSFLLLKRLCYCWLLEAGEYEYPILSQDLTFVNPTERIYTTKWNPHCLPFMKHWLGPTYCIDLVPGPHGRVGQILFFNDRYQNYPDYSTSPAIEVIAVSIQEFFAHLASDLESGMYTLDVDTGILWSQEMKSGMTKAQIKSFDESTGTWQTENYLSHLKQQKLHTSLEE